MEMKTMRTCLALACLSLVFSGSGCGSNATSGPLDATAFGAKYKIHDNSEMPGWKQDPDPNNKTPFKVYVGEDLVAEIDGAAQLYTDKGARLSMYQYLVGSGLETCTVIAMDFVTDAKATDIFNYQKDSYGASDPIPGFDTSVAIGSFALGNATVFAHFKAMYFELPLSGFPNGDQTLTYQGAAQFLTALKAKTN